MKSFAQFLEEKLIVYNGGKSSGQVVFLAGGGASGKGYAINKFIDSKTYKIYDVDAMKASLLKLNQLKGKYPELNNLDLRRGADVFKMHQFVKDLNLDNKILDNLLSRKPNEQLPNIMFDMTLKDKSKIEDLLPRLLEVGYKPEDIHLTWVLTNYSIAVANNAQRSRIVPDDVLLKTHEGAALTMYDLVSNGLPRGLNGSIQVILNNPEHTVFFADKDGKSIGVIKDFKYLTLKKSGKALISNKEVKAELYQWIIKNVPKTAITALAIGN